MSFIEKYDEPFAWPEEFGSRRVGFAHVHHNTKVKQYSKVKSRPQSRASVVELANAIVEFEKKIKLLAAKQEFDRLAQEWTEQTQFLSNVETKIMHPAYQRIISLGKSIVPFILEQLESDMNDWFWALTIITGENPIPSGREGDIEGMTSAWLDWGRTQGFIR